MKIAIIGTGNLGCSIAKGLITNNAITTLYLTKRNLDDIKEFEGYKNVYLTTDNELAIKNSDILILAVQPGHLENILEQIKPILHDNHVLISTVTGFSLTKIEDVVGKEQFIIRAMPNTAIAVGKSMTCICANEKGEKRIKIAEAIFNRLGTSVHIPGWTAILPSSRPTLSRRLSGTSWSKSYPNPIQTALYNRPLSSSPDRP